MPTGFVSFLMTSCFAILLSTGWFQGLGQELAETSDRRLVIGLVFSAFVSFLEMPITERVIIHLHLLPLVILFFRLLVLIKDEIRFVVFSSFLFVGAVLFLIDELKVIEPIWNLQLLDVGVILFLLLCAFGIVHSLQERACILLGGILSAEVFALILYWPERQWIGSGEMVSLVWFSLGVLMIMHIGWRRVFHWVKVWKQY